MGEVEDDIDRSREGSILRSLEVLLAAYISQGNKGKKKDQE